MEKQKHEVLLSVDNCSAHGHVTKAILLEYVPPNMTRTYQPIGPEGMGSNNQWDPELKMSFYNSLLLCCWVLCLDGGKSHIEWIRVDLLSAISMLADACRVAISDTLRNCFWYTRFPLDDELSCRVMALIDNLQDVGFAVFTALMFEEFTDMDSTLY